MSESIDAKLQNVQKSSSRRNSNHYVRLTKLELKKLVKLSFKVLEKFEDF